MHALPKQLKASIDQTNEAIREMKLQIHEIESQNSLLTKEANENFEYAKQTMYLFAYLVAPLTSQPVVEGRLLSDIGG